MALIQYYRENLRASSEPCSIIEMIRGWNVEEELQEMWGLFLKKIQFNVNDFCLKYSTFLLKLTNTAL